MFLAQIMRQWRNLYLVRLFTFHKVLGIVVCIFFIVNIVFNSIMPSQIAPFYNWSLYSYPIPAQKTFSFYEVVYNDGEVLRFKRTWQEPRKILLNNTMNLFINTEIFNIDDYTKKHFYGNWLPQHPRFPALFPSFTNFPTKSEMQDFPFWYKRYLAQHTNEMIDHIQVHKKVVAFDANARVYEISSELLYTIK